MASVQPINPSDPFAGVGSIPDLHTLAPNVHFSALFRGALDQALSVITDNLDFISFFVVLALAIGVVLFAWKITHVKHPLSGSEFSAYDRALWDYAHNSED